MYSSFKMTLVSFTGTTFAYNQNGPSTDVGAMGGGAVFVHSSQVTIDSCLFAHNTVYSASDAGGAIYNLISDLTITNSKFWGNIGGQGGTIGTIGSLKRLYYYIITYFSYFKHLMDVMHLIHLMDILTSLILYLPIILAR